MSTTVLLDATSIPADSGGVGRYLRELVPELARRDDLVLHVACQRRDVPWLTRDAPGAVLHPAPADTTSVARRLVWEQLALPRLARRVGADVIHSPHYTMPLVTRIPRVVTLHDATFFSHPELHGRLKGPFFRRWIRLASQRATRCIAPSQATADEVARWAGAPARPIVVSFHGVDTERYSPGSRAREAEMRRSLAIGEAPYVAFVGTVEPRKNVGPLLDAITRLAERRPELAPRLLLAGGRGWDEPVIERLEAAAPGAAYRWLGYVDEQLLPSFVASSTLVAYPSVGEGFGLPILEALASGVPVVTTDRLAAPEVGGDVAVYCEPDAASIENALEALLDDDARRDELGRRGRERGLTFTWRRTADEHAAVYAGAARRRS
ncbi:glycosyltransferase family 1 protein [Frigoribacterium sp. PvP032]|uniref:glycosyltransferase family 4 protein n=1 Tax=Frigoribacterium sp. PvP032 TaxID=2806589 RepID=UPI001AEABDF1|nr:glycosyltransferase family 1 protein [Frigoribacterium sp. PvP032]MBP1190256.1 glycosyltransferase involved in cell wall biosynthesis [Frigoribacterium sp. PvP032]